MNAIILAAGVGSRLRPITNKKPKTLVQVDGRPIISYIVDSLLVAGVNRIVVCVGYRSDQVKSYLLDKYREKVELVFVENTAYETTNNMYSLYLARKYIHGDFFLMNGDLVFETDLLREMASLEGSWVAVDRGAYNDESMKIEVENGCVSSIAKTIKKERSFGCSIDVYKFDGQASRVLVKEVVRIIEVDDDQNQWTEVLLDKVFSAGIVPASPFDIKNKKWFEIDNYQDLVEADLLFCSRISELKKRCAFIIDKDGTLAVGNTPIEGAEGFLQKLSAAGNKWLVGSNNSSRTTADHEESLRAMFPSVPEVHVLSSLDVAVKELKHMGVDSLYWVANGSVSHFLSKSFRYEEDEPDVALLTYDDEIDYKKLTSLIRILGRGAKYFATHTDVVCPTEGGFVPDVGAFIELIESATNRIPTQTFGKPQKEFIKNSVKAMGVEYGDAVLIGDRLYTDIASCEGKDILSVLVLSGETDRTSYEFSDIRADVVVSSVARLSDYV